MAQNEVILGGFYCAQFELIAKAMGTLRWLPGLPGQLLAHKREIVFICLKAASPVCVGEGLRLILRKGIQEKNDESPSPKYGMVFDWLFVVSCAMLVMESLKTLVNFVIFKTRASGAESGFDDKDKKLHSHKQHMIFRQMLDITFMVPGALASLAVFLYWATLCRLTAAVAEPLKVATVPLMALVIGVIAAFVRGVSISLSTGEILNESPDFLLMAGALLLFRCVWGDGTHVPYGPIATLCLSIMTTKMSTMFLRSYVQPRAKNSEQANVYLDALFFHFWSTALALVLVITTGGMGGFRMLQHIRPLGIPEMYLFVGMCCELALMNMSLPAPTEMIDGRPVLRQLVICSNVVTIVLTVVLSFFLLPTATAYFIQPVFLVGLTFTVGASAWRSSRSLEKVREVVAALKQMCIQREKQFAMQREMARQREGREQQELKVDYELEIEEVVEEEDDSPGDYVLQDDEDQYVPDEVDMQAAATREKHNSIV